MMTPPDNAILNERLKSLEERMEDGFERLDKKLDTVCAFQSGCPIQAVEERVRWHDKIIMLGIGAQFTIIAGLFVLLFQIMARGKP